MIHLINYKKIFIILFVCGILISGGLSVEAGFLNPSTGGVIDGFSQNVANTAGFDESGTIGGVMSYVIKAFLGLLGIIFVSLLVLEGYKWMMARGDEEKVREAKDGIMRAVIGIIIVVSAYAITYFVFSNLPGGGSGGGPLTGN
jgi:cytochrome bd-type quinol oxidase subunit 2